MKVRLTAIILSVFFAERRIIKMKDETILDIIFNIISNNIHKKTELTLSSRFEDIGINSITYLKSIVQIESTLNFEFDDDFLDVHKVETIEDLFKQVRVTIIKKNKTYSS